MPRILRSFAPLVLALLPLGCGTDPRAAPDFTLQDDGGAPWRLSDQRDGGVLLAFGFTHCADTCPALLAKLARTTQTLGERSSRVEIAFVTVDPKRDTPAALRRFLARFSQPGASRIVGLTGTPQEIAVVEREYGIFSKKVPARRGDYDVEHSATIFLIDRGGAFRGLADETISDGALVSAIRSMVR